MGNWIKVLKKMKQTIWNKLYQYPYQLIIVTAIIFLLGGCAKYQPEPLPRSIDLVPEIHGLLSPGAWHGIDPAKGLSPAEISALAVRNNPDLKAQRKRLGVAKAQLYSARMFPDPQLSANLDHPVVNTIGTVNALSMALSYDILPLINRKERISIKEQALNKTRLQLLWQEWQVSQKARSLAVRLYDQRRQINLLHKMKALYLQRYQNSHRALLSGDVTFDVTGTDLTALLDISSQITQLKQTCNNTGYALNLLLGLAPGNLLEIRLSPIPVLIDSEKLRMEIKNLPKRRPDLLALQAGYNSQEARVRAAILSQFPSISIGISHARDTGSIYTNGFNIGLNLPFFSANRGAIAVERATREQLRREYQARLDHTSMEVDKLIRLHGIIEIQRQQLAKYLPDLKKLVISGRAAYQRGDIDDLTFLNMETTWIKKRKEEINLDQMQRENLIALQTLLAIPESAISKGTGRK